jgi:hypothetical protein
MAGADNSGLPPGWTLGAPDPAAGLPQGWTLGIPTQELRAPSAEDAARLAKTKWEGIRGTAVDDPNRSAGIGATLSASLQPDLQRQIEVYAKSRGISTDRYGVDREGNVGYLDDKGEFVREIPSIEGATGPIDALRRTGQWLGSQAGPFIPAALGTVAGALTSPIGGGIPGASAGAAVGETARQVIANAIADRPLTDLSPGSIAGQAALGAGGQAVAVGAGAGARALFDRNPLKAAGFDSARLVDPANRQAWADLSAEAQRRGITLTPGNVASEVPGSPEITAGRNSLLVNERQIARQPEASDIMASMYARRSGAEVPKAVRAELDNISPVAAPEIGARQGAEGARKVLDKLEADRTAAASPHYNAAFDSGVIPDVTATTDLIANLIPRASKSEMGYINDAAAAINRARLADPADVYAQMHNAKLEVDNLLAKIPRELDDPAIQRSAARQMTQIQQQLTRDLRNAHPEYEAGYQQFIDKSRPIEEASKGLTGIMAEPSRVYFGAVPNMIAGGDSLSISAARNAFDKAGQRPAWDANVRAYLESSLRDAAKVNAGGQPGNVAGKFYSDVFGDETARANLREAVGDPAKFASLEQLFRVLKAASTSLPEASPTATDLGSRSKFVGGAAQVAGETLKGTKFWDIPSRLGDFLQDVSAGRNAERLAAIYTSPDAMAQLNQLRMLSPTSEKALRIVTNVLTDAGVIAGRRALNRPGETMPPALQQPPGAPGGVP